MPGFTLNKKINSNRLWLAVLAVLWLASLPEAAAQVLTLDSRECVKVEAKFSELVPYNKYNKPFINSYDLPPPPNQKRDTSGILIEDELTLFYIWRNNAVLRIVTRKEPKNTVTNKSNTHISLSVVSLVGKTQKQVNQEIFQLDKQKSCKYLSTYEGKIEPSPDNSLIITPNCIPLVFNNNNKKELYRIIGMSWFKIGQTTNVEDIYYKTILFDYNINHARVGFTEKERRNIYESNPKHWLYKLGEIYSHLFSWNSYRNDSQPLPYLTSQQLKQWPRYFLFPFNREAQKQFTPLYGRSSVKGYYFYDENLHPETKGYVVVPGKFFLPRRLQIVSVNDVPWQE